MKRYAFKMKFKPGCKEEYKKRHDQIWPKLENLLKEAGISEYSIFFDEGTNTLFAYQKQSGNCSSQNLGNNSIVKKWWDYMADLCETNQDNSPVSIPLEEVFYME